MTTTCCASCCTTSPGTAGRSRSSATTSPGCTAPVPKGRTPRCPSCRCGTATSRTGGAGATTGRRSPTGASGSQVRPYWSCRPTIPGQRYRGIGAGSTRSRCPPSWRTGWSAPPASAARRCSWCCSPPTRCCSPATAGRPTSWSARPRRGGTTSSSRGWSATSPTPWSCEGTCPATPPSRACWTARVRPSWPRWHTRTCRSRSC